MKSFKSFDNGCLKKKKNPLSCLFPHPSPSPPHLFDLVHIACAEYNRNCVNMLIKLINTDQSLLFDSHFGVVIIVIHPWLSFSDAKGKQKAGIALINKNIRLLNVFIYSLMTPFPNNQL